MRQVIEFLQSNGVPEAEKKATQLHQYERGLLKWNEKVNLTTISNHEDFLRDHLLDSLQCVSSEEFQQAQRIMDLGTGGGFPGIPLAVAFPEKEFILMDATAKRLAVIDELSGEIGIGNVQTLHGRAEELGHGKELRETFDLVVSRAVARLATLAEYSLPFLRVGGTFIAYKGRDVEEEWQEAAFAIGELGGERLRWERASDDPNSRKQLLYIRKAVPCDPKYPRRNGMPKKRPLLKT